MKKIIWWLFAIGLVLFMISGFSPILHIYVPDGSGEERYIEKGIIGVGSGLWYIDLILIAGVVTPGLLGSSKTNRILFIILLPLALVLNYFFINFKGTGMPYGQHITDYYLLVIMGFVFMASAAYLNAFSTSERATRTDLLDDF